MKIVAQMDEITSIDITKDSTFAILFEAQNQGHDIYYYLPSDLSLEDGQVKSNIHQIKLQNKIGEHVEVICIRNDDLTNYDIILIRQDPPFDMNYISSTYILDKIKDRVRIINNPTEIRDCPEKIFVTDFKEFTPPTLITSNLEEIQKFKEKHQEIILKPLYGCGGEGINHIKTQDTTTEEVATSLIKKYQAPLVAQKYIKEVSDGDKRILLLDGEVIGAVNRVAAKGQTASNFHMGGKAQKTTLTNREKEICNKLGPELKKRGLIFVGIDVIGDYVTEINVTSPTGINEINTLNNDKIETKIVKFLSTSR